VSRYVSAQTSTARGLNPETGNLLLEQCMDTGLPDSSTIDIPPGTPPLHLPVEHTQTNLNAVIIHERDSDRRKGVALLIQRHHLLLERIQVRASLPGPTDFLHQPRLICSYIYIQRLTSPGSQPPQPHYLRSLGGADLDMVGVEKPDREIVI
jgi:hypothetical protein